MLEKRRASSAFFLGKGCPATTLPGQGWEFCSQSLQIAFTHGTARPPSVLTGATHPTFPCRRDAIVNRVGFDFAETRNLYSAESVTDDADSSFEDSVYEFLRDNGQEVRKQIGCAGFHVDLGVVDTSQPGRYLLGLECDGAK